MTRFGPDKAPALTINLSADSIAALAQPRADAFRVTVDDRMRLREGRWDGQRSRAELSRYAETSDGVDWRRAARGYTVFDLDPDGDRDPVQSDGKLPVAYVEDGELVGIGNGIRNALARLDQTQGLGDSVRRDARAALESMLARLNEQTADRISLHTTSAQARGIADAMDKARRRLADVERSEQERAEIRDKFPRLVNMTPGEMRAWMDSPFTGPRRKSGDARASAREALNDVIRLKEKRMSEWTDGDYDDAVEAIAFIERMSEVDQGEPLRVEGREGPSARDAALKDWGHDPSKADGNKRDAVMRWSRLDIALDEREMSLLDRAVAVADRIETRGDAASLKAIASELKADGLDDYIQDGFLMLPVLAARTGTQIYSDGVSSWGEYRSDEEVEASLRSYGLKPFTDDHPPGMVTGQDYTDYAKGSCGQDAVLLPPGPDGNRYVRVTVLVGDAATIRKIRDGKVELSAGYTTVTVRDAGTDPTGKTYAFRQTDIRINHLALVDRGRAGPLARIRPDGAAWELPTPTEDQDQEHDHVTEPKKDQLDPAMARLLLVHAMAYLMPPTPEEGAEALTKLVEMTGLESAEISSLLEHEMPEEEDMEMVEMDGGIKAKMTADDAKKYRASKTQATSDAAEASRLKADLAETRAELNGYKRKVDQLVEAKERADLDALYEEIREVCPQLVEAWDGQKAKKTFALDAAQMREKATLDLDPEAADELEEARGTDTFDATLRGAYRSAVRGARKRKRHAGGEGRNDSHNTGSGGMVVAMDRLRRNHKQFVGSN